MKIFEPIKIKNVLFPNRVVMAPMVPFGMPELPGGVMSDTLLRHYLELSDGKFSRGKMSVSCGENLSVSVTWGNDQRA